MLILLYQLKNYPGSYHERNTFFTSRFTSDLEINYDTRRNTNDSHKNVDIDFCFFNISCKNEDIIQVIPKNINLLVTLSYEKISSRNEDTIQVIPVNKLITIRKI